MLDVEQHLRKAGARVITAGHLDTALPMAGHPDLSGAVIDLCLGAESATPIFQRLADRNLPFVVHTGYATEALAREWPSVPIIQKPATPHEITDALAHSLLFANGRVALVAVPEPAHRPGKGELCSAAKRRTLDGPLLCQCH